MKAFRISDPLFAACHRLRRAEKSFGFRGAGPQPVFRYALLAAVLIALVGPRPAFAWGDRAHAIITEEAVRRLPEPFRGLLDGEGSLSRLKEASIAPDQRLDKLKSDRSAEYQVERAKHFFDIDAITTEPPPFAHFPRDRVAAEREFGAAAFQKSGTAPWAAEDALKALTEALSRGETEGIFRAAGDLAHFAADIHMPFHVTKNYDGQLTGNWGVHKALEIGLVNRYADFYAAAVREGRTEVQFLEDAEDGLFQWIAQAHARVPPILEAETAARRATGYSPGLEPAARESPDYPRLKAAKEADLDNLAAEPAKAYYAAFKRELEARGSPEALAMRDAADHVAALLYTAWVRAGKPPSLALAPAPAAPQGVPIWFIALTAAMFILLFLPRRRRAS